MLVYADGGRAIEFQIAYLPLGCSCFPDDSEIIYIHDHGSAALVTREENCRPKKSKVLSQRFLGS